MPRSPTPSLKTMREQVCKTGSFHISLCCGMSEHDPALTRAAISYAGADRAFELAERRSVRKPIDTHRSGLLSAASSNSLRFGIGDIAAAKPERVWRARGSLLRGPLIVLGKSGGREH